MRVRAEVPGAAPLGAAHHHHPGVLLVERDREVGVALVVPVADVEPRVELLDPGVLQLERLDLGAHHGPVHPGGRPQHGLGPRVQAGEVGEVGVQPGPQVLRLADVDDPAGASGTGTRPATRGSSPAPAGRTADLPRSNSIRGRPWLSVRRARRPARPPGPDRAPGRNRPAWPARRGAWCCPGYGQEPFAEGRVSLHHTAPHEIGARVGEHGRDGEQPAERHRLLPEDLQRHRVARLAVAPDQLGRPGHRLDVGEPVPG